MFEFVPIFYSECRALGVPKRKTYVIEKLKTGVIRSDVKKGLAHSLRVKLTFSAS